VRVEVSGLRAPDPHLALPSTERLRVNEIFYSIQGESTHAGRPCVLVRLTGCQMRCVWCDSEYSFYEGSWMSVEEVLAEVGRLGCGLVEVTGGEPLLQPGALPLMRRLCEHGYEVLLETGGGLDISRVDSRVRRIVDVKCPASGEHRHNLWSNLDRLTPHDELKFVVADRRDYEWAREQLHERRLAELCPVSFSPVVAPVEARVEAPLGSVGSGLEPAELAAWMLADRLPVRLGLQLHKLLWGGRTRGV
jgi:7-carboxy-7-deazaguanine synthase